LSAASPRAGSPTESGDCARCCWALQATALALFLPFDGLAALYVVSALFGLFQGGIVPSYPLIVREHFSPREAGSRTGTVIMATLVGMALGGWMPGWIFDMTGSYRAAFINGIAWSLVTAGIALFLLFRARPGWGLPATPVVSRESHHPS
jgi:MFS family permease